MMTVPSLSRPQQTAHDPSDSGVLITHPFHPFRGQRLPILHRGASAACEWLLLQLPDGPVLRIPVAWTELSAPDSYVLAGQGRASFRVPDLLELRSLLDSLLPELRQ